MKDAWIETYTGQHFYPLTPEVHHVKLVDIAHALSMKCRYTGHCSTFYSIAEHSIHVSKMVPRKDALWGLFHDATEAYLPDIASPIKKHIQGFKEIEDRLMATIAVAIGLDGDMPESVKQADKRILVSEAYLLMNSKGKDWNLPYGKPDVFLPRWEPKRAAFEFINTYRSIINGQAVHVHGSR